MKHRNYKVVWPELLSSLTPKNLPLSDNKPLKDNFMIKYYTGKQLIIPADAILAGL